MAESQGVEPCDRISTVYGLAIRCITILPTLHYLEEDYRIELSPRKGWTGFQVQLASKASIFLMYHDNILLLVYRVSIWQPFEDSNLGMSESKSDALDQLGERATNYT